jgi:hypothetical protein
VYTEVARAIGDQTIQLDRPFPIAVNPAQLRQGLDPD